MKTKWDDEKQARLDALRDAQLAGTLDDAGQAELDSLIELLEAEERERLEPALARIRQEQAALRQQVQESEATNEQLSSLAEQQERWLADAGEQLRDLRRRHQEIQDAYRAIRGGPVAVT